MAKKIPNAIDKFVGQRVRMRRLMLNMSQEKLADAIGLTFQQVQKYEKGVNRIGGSRMQQIADVLQVSPGWFFGDEKSKANPGADIMAQMLVLPHGVELAQHFTTLSNQDRARLADIAARLASTPVQRKAA